MFRHSKAISVFSLFSIALFMHLGPYNGPALKKAMDKLKKQKILRDEEEAGFRALYALLEQHLEQEKPGIEINIPMKDLCGQISNYIAMGAVVFDV